MLQPGSSSQRHPLHVNAGAERGLHLVLGGGVGPLSEPTSLWWRCGDVTMCGTGSKTGLTVLLCRC